MKNRANARFFLLPESNTLSFIIPYMNGYHCRWRDLAFHQPVDDADGIHRYHDRSDDECHAKSLHAKNQGRLLVNDAFSQRVQEGE